jgi:hypothetical protein
MMFIDWFISIENIFNGFYRSELTVPCFLMPTSSPQIPGLVIHELFHGLGFGSGGWLDAFDANGKRRTIIQQLKAGPGDFPHGNHGIL